MKKVNRKRAVIISVILFVLSIGWIFVAFFVPYIGNTESFDNDNTFEHSATVDYTKTTKDAFEIHIIENDQTLAVGNSFLKGKTELLKEIKAGDAIVFRIYYADIYDMPNVDEVNVCAFSINNKPILTIEEFNSTQQKSTTFLRVFVIVLATIFISLGVFLLVRAFRKPKEKAHYTEKNNESKED